MGGRFHDFGLQYGVSITGPDSVRVDPRGIAAWRRDGAFPPQIAGIVARFLQSVVYGHVFVYNNLAYLILPDL